MTPRARRIAEASALLLLAALGVGALLISLRLGLGGEEAPGPGLFPAAAAALLLLLLLPIALGIRLPPVVPESAADDDAADPGGWRRLCLYLLAMMLAALALMPLGFVVGVGLALLLVLRQGERLSWVRAVAVTAGSVAACFVLFDRLLEVPLPRGAFWPG